jgi:hypothetical protein
MLLIQEVKRESDEFKVTIEIRGPILGTKSLEISVEAASYGEVLKQARERLREFAQQIVEAVKRDASHFR